MNVGFFATFFFQKQPRTFPSDVARAGIFRPLFVNSGNAPTSEGPKSDTITSIFGYLAIAAESTFCVSAGSQFVTSDGNVLGCFWKKNVAKNPTFKLYTVSTQNDHARLAMDWAIALATGGKKPATTHFPSLVFEDSTTGKPNPVECKANLPGDIYLSAQLPAVAQAKLVR